MAVSGRLPRNLNSGHFIDTVERLGHVPPCVRDAFSWLPHPWGQEGRGRNARLVWFWERYEEEYRQPPAPEKPGGSRCWECVFQEPAWSQGYAGCSHSWLNDEDGDCRAFVGRDEILARFPGYAEFCRPPGIAPGLLHKPYWSDGSTYADFGPSCNFPSGYHARLNLQGWFESGARTMYLAVDQERLRRFWQWAEQETLEQIGVFQPNLFLSTSWDD